MGIEKLKSVLIGEDPFNIEKIISKFREFSGRGVLPGGHLSEGTITTFDTDSEILIKNTLNFRFNSPKGEFSKSPSMSWIMETRGLCFTNFTGTAQSTLAKEFASITSLLVNIDLIKDVMMKNMAFRYRDLNGMGSLLSE